MRRAGAEVGYTIDAGWLPPSQTDEELVRCTVAPDGLGGSMSMDTSASATWSTTSTRSRSRESLKEFFGGRAPSAVNLRDRGALAHLAPVGVRRAVPAQRQLPFACLTATFPG